MFQEDLEIGLKQERILLERIKEKYHSATQIDAYKGYDIWIPEISTSIEVKYDRMSHETGNLFIEIEYGGNPSGLMTTEADYWVIMDRYDYLMISPRNMFRCIIMHRLEWGEFVGTGDSKRKKGYLIKKDLLKKYGKIIF